MKYRFSFLPAALLLLLTGCISFEYNGEREAAPSATVTLFNDGEKIPRPTRILGYASASGNDQDVSYEDLREKLISEAKKIGADAILITDRQIVPGELQEGINPPFDSAFDYDDSSRSWQQIQRDVDRNYGNVRQGDYHGSVQNYRRVLKAQFLVYLPESTSTTTEISPATSTP